MRKSVTRCRASFVRQFGMATDNFYLGQRVPNQSEGATVGAIHSRVHRGSPEFKALVKNTNPDIMFKDEEHTGADRLMTPRLKTRLDKLASLVKAEWPGKRLRVTEAWHENVEHAVGSQHYEGRAADTTVSDKDGAKLGRLARLAVQAGFDWVFFENAFHIHGSVKRA